MKMEVLCNQTIFYQKPPDICIDTDMKLTETNLITISIYSVLFVLSSIFNLSILIFLSKSKLKEQFRIHKYMFNLIIADLIITFITIPLEIGWKYTVYWRAGDLACRLFQFLRPLGIYLASFMIISLCIDRYYAIVHPLKIENSKLRTQVLIYSSWILSIACAIPQIFVFSLKTHPKHRWYTQCLDFKIDLTDDSNSFYKIAFVLYQVFVSTITFFLPLLVIVITYGCILMEIIGKLNTKKKEKDNFNSILLLSQNRKDTIIKAKRKTLKLAITIVIVFLICWTPYYSISVLFWLDPTMANKIDPKIYNFLFIFAVSNCLANPLVYGMTSLKLSYANKYEKVSMPPSMEFKIKSRMTTQISRT